MDDSILPEVQTTAKLDSALHNRYGTNIFGLLVGILWRYNKPDVGCRWSVVNLKLWLAGII
jgi:hypothetical protein